MERMEQDEIYQAFMAALEDDRSQAAIARATQIPENSLAQYKRKRSLGGPYRHALRLWLEEMGYLSAVDDPLADSIQVLRQALELSQNTAKPRSKRAAVLLELLSFVETHFGAELGQIAQSGDVGPRL